MVKHAAGLPPELARRAVRLLRPRDAGRIYSSNPSAELGRLAERGLLRKVASGYFVIVPPERVGDRRWRPPLVATAWGIAAADYGIDAVAVCGPSAARHHGLIPREQAVAFVAVPKQRPRLLLLGGQARFVRRHVEHLDLERWTSPLGDGWVTTLEQTVLDIAGRVGRATLPEGDLWEALQAAAPRLDRALLHELGRAHRQGAAATRVLTAIDGD